jgi:hypothetical protein
MSNSSPITFSFRVHAPIPIYGAETGDHLVIGLERTHYPVSVIRHFEDADGIAGVLLNGALRLGGCSDVEATMLLQVTHEQAVRAILRRFPTPAPSLQPMR